MRKTHLSEDELSKFVVHFKELFTRDRKVTEAVSARQSQLDAIYNLLRECHCVEGDQEEIIAALRLEFSAPAYRDKQAMYLTPKGDLHSHLKTRVHDVCELIVKAEKAQQKPPSKRTSVDRKFIAKTKELDAKVNPAEKGEEAEKVTSAPMKDIKHYLEFENIRKTQPVKVTTEWVKSLVRDEVRKIMEFVVPFLSKWFTPQMFSKILTEELEAALERDKKTG